MSAVLLVPAVLSVLLLAAHFFRAGNLILVGLCLLSPLLLLIRRAWAVHVIQLVLLLGALEWLRTVVHLIHLRQQSDEPWTRMAVILAAVAAFTLFSGLAFAAPPLRRRYFAAAR